MMVHYFLCFTHIFVLTCFLVVHHLYSVNVKAYDSIYIYDSHRNSSGVLVEFSEIIVEEGKYEGGNLLELFAIPFGSISQGIEDFKTCHNFYCCQNSTEGKERQSCTTIRSLPSKTINSTHRGTYSIDWGESGFLSQTNKFYGEVSSSYEKLWNFVNFITFQTSNTYFFKNRREDFMGYHIFLKNPKSNNLSISHILFTQKQRDEYSPEDEQLHTYVAGGNDLIPLSFQNQLSTFFDLLIYQPSYLWFIILGILLSIAMFINLAFVTQCLFQRAPLTIILKNCCRTKISSIRTRLLIILSIISSFFSKVQKHTSLIGFWWNLIWFVVVLRYHGKRNFFKENFKIRGPIYYLVNIMLDFFVIISSLIILFLSSLIITSYSFELLTEPTECTIVSRCCQLFSKSYSINFNETIKIHPEGIDHESHIFGKNEACIANFEIFADEVEKFQNFGETKYEQCYYSEYTYPACISPQYTLDDDTRSICSITSDFNTTGYLTPLIMKNPASIKSSCPTFFQNFFEKYLLLIIYITCFLFVITIPFKMFGKFVFMACLTENHERDATTYRILSIITLGLFISGILLMIGLASWQILLLSKLSQLIYIDYLSCIFGSFIVYFLFDFLYGFHIYLLRGWTDLFQDTFLTCIANSFILGSGIDLYDENDRLVISRMVIKSSFYNYFISNRINDVNSRLENSAPVGGNISVLFTDIQGSTRIWDEAPRTMKKCLKLHNDLFRKVLLETNGYEVKTEGDAFMITFSREIDACKFALTCQKDLMNIKWPKELYKLEPGKQVMDVNDVMIYSGIRVRMGINCGKVHVQKDPTTGRYDYFGNIINNSARLEAYGNGGVISIGSNVYKKIKKILGNKRKEIKAFGMRVFVKDMGLVKLKGISKEERVYVLFPYEYRNRRIERTKQTLAGKLPLVAFEEKKKALSSSSEENLESTQVCFSSEKKLENIKSISDDYIKLVE